MLTDKMIGSLNDQINKELYSGYLYLGMSSYATNRGLNGIANWFYIQTLEEYSHARKFYDYINEQGVRVKLQAIDEPPQEFSSALDLFEKTLKHEQMVTKLINDLATLARAENDHATEIFLQWFVTEQVEEEANASDLLNKFKLVGDNGHGILMIDNELAQRTFVPPQAAAE